MNKYQEALDKIVAASCPQHVACSECDIEKVCNCDMKWYIDRLQELIDNQPKHARWEHKGYLDMHCSNCGNTPECEEGYTPPEYDYCPHCGAIMDN